MREISRRSIELYHKHHAHANIFFEKTIQKYALKAAVIASKSVEDYGLTDKDLVDAARMNKVS
jgi:hypothetical protein